VGGILAVALYQHLVNREMDVFYDIESIRAGQFDTIILNQIAARPYFLLVLTPGTLERCHDPGDWLRREIEQAISTRRVIVPVHTPNFEFGDLGRFLPEGLGEAVRRFNGQELPQRWFKFAVQQLVEEFLVPISAPRPAVSDRDQAVVDQMLQVAQAAPTITPVELSAQEYFERAFARPSDDTAGKIADYDEAIRLKPDYHAAFNNRGIARNDKGDIEGAIADSDEAIRLKPDYAVAFCNRGIARKDKGDIEGAIADYDEAIRLKPDYHDAFNNRGIARGAKGDIEGAIADYDEAIRLKPDYAVAFYNRGIARGAKGDIEGEIADYDEAIRLKPDYPDAWTSDPQNDR
jgi:tetratricopeptide (TPR) repeat protein